MNLSSTYLVAENGNIIDYVVECAVPFPIAPFVRRGRSAMDSLGLRECRLSLVLTDDQQIQALNRRWRHKDSPTDVLSFPMFEAGNVGRVQETIGDIVISMDTAVLQATERKHSVESEVTILFVHGLCHLMGYTHGNAKDANRMAQLENTLVCVMTEGLTGLDTGLVQATIGATDV